MTNEEAIHNLYALKLRTKILSDKKALEMAIKALEQQPYKDWLSTFNTESATACFTAVQELKKRVDVCI